MFPSLTLIAKNRFDLLGILAESLLFYQKTNLILDQKSLPEALATIGYNNLVELINEGDLVINVSSNGLAVGNTHGNEYILSSVQKVGDSKNKVIAESTEQSWGRNIQSGNQKKHLFRLIGNHVPGSSYQALTNSEVLNIDNFKDAILLHSSVYKSEEIEIEISSKHSAIFNIESNVEKQVIISAAHTILEATSQIHSSVLYTSELYCNKTISTYPATRLQRLFDKRSRSQQQIGEFHSFVLPNFYDLRGTIDSGHKKFIEFMLLWRKAKKFKSWLERADPDAELLQNYIAKISENSWLDRLDVRVARWILFRGAAPGIGAFVAGIPGIAAGAAVGQVVSEAVDLFDDFVLDGLLRGYKPNQFVDNNYKNFLLLKKDE